MEWLLNRVPGFAQLSDDERTAIIDFSLLWPLFEARVLNNNGNAASICRAIQTWADRDDFDPAIYDPELDYFRSRYFGNGQFTRHFENLKLRGNDEIDLVRSVLQGDADPVRRVSCVFIVVLRYRNNLFHGLKWEYLLAGQRENFSTANSALVKALERHGDLDHG